MKKNNKNKIRLLLIIGVLVLWLVYDRKISSTIEFYREVKQMKAKVMSAPPDRENLDMMKNELVKISGMVSGSGQTGRIQQQLIDFFNSGKSGDLVIREVREPVTDSMEKYILETHSVTLGGEFKPLLTAIHELESRPDLGRVVSLDFKVQENRKTKQKELTVDVYLQNLSFYEN